MKPSQAAGSSPHTRGALARLRTSRLGRRIIPAYAGSTPTADPTPWRSSDHPRIRGEHISCGSAPGRKFGSSPHTRGARPPPRRSVRIAGIIPAYAGSTILRRTATTMHRDHPRIRGEHGMGGRSIVTRSGSSPHTRGARGAVDAEPGPPGIIPAYAGSTSDVCVLWVETADHPRIRGEHAPRRLDVHIREGSSPHTRGAHSRT